jgi:spermidine synthase
MRFGEHSLTIQSEAQVTYTTGKSKKGDRKAKVDHSTLTNEHHVLMLSALATALPPTDDRAPSVAILGFGAGLLGMFLRTRLTQVRQAGMCVQVHGWLQWHVTGIELDRQVLDIGRAHFALSSNDDRMTVVEADAIEYMQKTGASIWTLVD